MPGFNLDEIIRRDDHIIVEYTLSSVEGHGPNFEGPHIVFKWRKGDSCGWNVIEEPTRTRSTNKVHMVKLNGGEGTYKIEAYTKHFNHDKVLDRVATTENTEKVFKSCPADGQWDKTVQVAEPPSTGSDSDVKVETEDTADMKETPEKPGNVAVAVAAFVAGILLLGRGGGR